MKIYIIATVLLTLSVSAFTVSASHAQEAQTVVPITVPYELTNLHPDVTGFSVECTVRYNGRAGTRWGRSWGTANVTPPNASGNLVVNVVRDDDARDLNLEDLERKSYRCANFYFFAGERYSSIYPDSPERYSRSVERVRVVSGNF